MGGQQKNFISDIVFFQHQDGIRKKVRRHFLQCWDWAAISAKGFLFFSPRQAAGIKFQLVVNVIILR
jgi:hypothetical protein